MLKTVVLSLVMSSIEKIGFSKLSKAWSKTLFQNSSPAITAALERTMPLLEDPTSVPFVVRYRGDVIAPLTTKNIHELSEYLETYKSLSSLRERILAKVPENEVDIVHRVETSVSKSELEDLYAPYKPPAKGSLEDRIQSEHPGLVKAVDAFWADPSVGVSKLKPFDAAVTVLANRIASHPETMDACQEYTNQWCRVAVKQAATKKDQPKDEDMDKYKAYHGFENAVNRLREYQVLAIRRGVDKKLLKISFEIDGDRAQGKIRASLGNRTSQHYKIYSEAIKDAWTRLLRKRCTSRAWKAVCNTADERAIQVFCDNLRKALLAPPAVPSRPVLGLDPGFRAGIKTALVDNNGHPVEDENALSTVHFVGNDEQGKLQLFELLKKYREHEQTSDKVVVALGNGHGSQEARKLLMEASQSSNIPVDVHLVNEAGASVWSVTEAANREFPDQPPASIAAVSIARRYQNPLPELVKIPPRSLGLGMYQHDFAEKVLDDKLQITSIDAVAEVGVNANACSLEILEKVPGMTKKLSERIIQARPIKSRNDLLKISGLGPKTFETCAAFIRVQGDSYLDRTMCHPESYDLANYLLKKLKWNVNDPSSLGDVPSEKERREKWKELIGKASKRHGVSDERVLSVLDHLIRSITNPDPRLDDSFKSKTNKEGDVNGCAPLASNLASLDELRKACPVRNVVGHIRNIVDFGAFVDFGGENDGLLHRSKLGRVALDSLLVGDEIGIDILGVSSNGRVTISVSGLDLSPENQDDVFKNRSGNGSDVRSRNNNKTKRRRASDKSSKPRGAQVKRRRTSKK